MDPDFDPLQYIASYDDLARAFGADGAAGRQHYRQFGRQEGRATDLFDEQQYLDNYRDLTAAFGDDGAAATLHYLNYGLREGRTDDAPLPDGFDGLQYIASHEDLIEAFGADPSAGARHYLDFGRDEGRAVDTFDERGYLANYPDVAAVFGGDGGAATLHYILFGRTEGRSDGPLPSAAADAFTVAEDSGPTELAVLANDADAAPNPDGPLTVVAVDTAGALGSVDLTRTGRVLYEPGDAFDGLAAGETATDAFRYTVENRAGVRDTAAVTVTVAGANDAPAALADAFRVAEDSGRFTFPVLDNDTDVDRGTELAVASVDGTGAAGAVEVSSDGRGVVYDPGGAFDLAAGELETDTFAYTVADGAGGESTGTVAMTITGVGEATPTAATASADFLL